jgi:hypothetical protein
MIDLNEIIEDNKGPELTVFEQEVEKLSQEQLERLNVEEGIYTKERVKGVGRDFLEISAAEVRWPKYFAAYQKVMGRPSILDPDQK